MKLQRKQIRAAILPLCLVSLLNSVACGDDGAMEGEEPGPVARADGGTGGATSSKPDASGTDVSAASAQPDSGTQPQKPTPVVDDDDDKEDGEPTTDPGNTLYKDGPACPKYGAKIAGTVEGATVAWTLSTIGKATAYGLERHDEESDTGYLVAKWAPGLKAGTLSMLEEGELTLPTQYTGGPYCLVEGSVQLDPTLNNGTDQRIFIKVTKVQKRVGTKCMGEDLPAELKICDRG